MRADALFANLTKRQSMLLLTAVTFGGAESQQALEHASEEDSEILRERAARLLAIPREQRIPFLVQEIKRLVVGRKGGDIRGASAEKVAAALKGERPALAEVLLRALPAALAEQVRNEIPPSSITLKREVRPEILSVIRWHFERRLEHLSPQSSSFLFADVQSLSARDFLTLADQLGAGELGPALASLGKADREAILHDLSAEQRSLASRAISDGQRAALDVGEAHELLEQLGAPEPRYRLRYAGLRRIVRACLAESADLAGRLAERHRDDLGRMLVAAIRAERGLGKAENGDELQQQIVALLEHLGSRGVVERPLRLPSPAALRERLSHRSGAAKRSLAPLPVPSPPISRQQTDPTGENEKAAAKPKPAPSSPPRRTSHAREYPAAREPSEAPPSVGLRPHSRRPGGKSRS